MPCSDSNATCTYVLKNQRSWRDAKGHASRAGRSAHPLDNVIDIEVEFEPIRQCRHAVNANVMPAHSVEIHIRPPNPLIADCVNTHMQMTGPLLTKHSHVWGFWFVTNVCM